MMSESGALGCRLSRCDRISPMQEAENVVCQRCGEAYARAMIQLRTVMALKKTPASERAAQLVELEGITPDAALAWLKHEMHKTCEMRLAHCPVCGGELTTWQAKWCRHCELDWH